MTDQSALDAKYFIDDKIYNCPFCRRRHVSYKLIHVAMFDWSTQKECTVVIVSCSSCKKRSMHLSHGGLVRYATGGYIMKSGDDQDAEVFYSVPTSFFVIDARIPAILRDLITEAEACLKMNLLTGASACTRKAIYELTVLQETTGEHYDDRIKELKSRFTYIDPELFNILGLIKDMTSDKVHEQSWPKWDSAHLKLF